MNGKEAYKIALKRAEDKVETKTLKIITAVAGLLLIFGAIIWFNGYILGIGIEIIGLIIFLTATIIKAREVNRYTNKLLDYYDFYGDLPAEEE